MGGGNGQKAKMAREKNMEKEKSVRGSQLESNKKAMNIQCCRWFLQCWWIMDTECSARCACQHSSVPQQR